MFKGRSELLFRQFQLEAWLWERALGEGEVQSGFRLGHAWSGLQDTTLLYLDLVLNASENEWNVWQARVNEYLQAVTSGPRLQMQALDSTLVGILSEGTFYELDLPETPSAWRSVSVLNTRRASRVDTVLEYDRRLRVQIQELGLALLSPDEFAAEFTRETNGDVTHHQSAAVERETREPVTLSHGADLLSAFKELSLIELSEFLKHFEETFNVSAGRPAAGAHLGRVHAPDDQVRDSFDVILEAVGEKKIQVIREVRALTSLGLGESKALVDSAPSVILVKVDRDLANELRDRLESVGAVVAVRDSNVLEGRHRSEGPPRQ